MFQDSWDGRSNPSQNGRPRSKTPRPGDLVPTSEFVVSFPFLRTSIEHSCPRIVWLIELFHRYSFHLHPYLGWPSNYHKTEVPNISSRIVSPPFCYTHDSWCLFGMNFRASKTFALNSWVVPNLRTNSESEAVMTSDDLNLTQWTLTHSAYKSKFWISVEFHQIIWLQNIICHNIDPIPWTVPSKDSPL